MDIIDFVDRVENRVRNHVSAFGGCAVAADKEVLTTIALDVVVADAADQVV